MEKSPPPNLNSSTTKHQWKKGLIDAEEREPTYRMCALSKHLVQPFVCTMSSDVTEFSLEESFAFHRRGETGSGKLMTLAQATQMASSRAGI